MCWNMGGRAQGLPFHSPKASSPHAPTPALPSRSTCPALSAPGGEARIRGSGLVLGPATC